MTTCCASESGDKKSDFPVTKRGDINSTPKKEYKGMYPEEDSPMLEREEDDSIRSRAKTEEMKRDSSKTKLI